MLIEHRCKVSLLPFGDFVLEGCRHCIASYALTERHAPTLMRGISGPVDCKQRCENEVDKPLSTPASSRRKSQSST